MDREGAVRCPECGQNYHVREVYDRGQFPCRSCGSYVSLSGTSEAVFVSTCSLYLKMAATQPRLLWCNTHCRNAKRCKQGGRVVEGGILLPCSVVDLSDECEIEEGCHVRT